MIVGFKLKPISDIPAGRSLKTNRLRRSAVLIPQLGLIPGVVALNQLPETVFRFRLAAVLAVFAIRLHQGKDSLDRSAAGRVLIGFELRS
jgi:hypothetical protein